MLNPKTVLGQVINVDTHHELVPTGTAFIAAPSRRFVATPITVAHLLDALQRLARMAMVVLIGLVIDAINSVGRDCRPLIVI